MVNLIIGLVCIEGYTGLKYKGSDNRGDQGRMDSEFREEQMFRGYRGAVTT